MSNCAESVAEMAEALTLFRQLSDEGRAKFLAYAQWLAAGADPATDPRLNDPYWLNLGCNREGTRS